MSVEPTKVAEIMGGARVLQQEVDTLADLQEVVAEGLPVAALNETTRYVAGSARAASRLRETLIPRATLARRSRLKLPESERVERLARMMALAESVWENRADARLFLHESHPMLGDRSPLEMAQTELGARRVEALLMKLEYNLPA
ncbi:MAG TPA: antitoxin Xre/MbcA/ParS toxin-binding domain-containing protein [Longimicrobiaceae bacterium]|nr:antitoxin Xre/MbcA/ParS toxin-binding domain-containing protein [Longimicrobiaceae bacterium]